MKKIVAAITIFVLGIAISTLLATAKPKPQPRAAEPPPLPMVDVMVATPESLQLHVKTQGTVQPHKEIDVVTQVAGLVQGTDANFAEGAFFQKEDLLLKIEDADYRFALIRAEAKVAEASQLLATERARAVQAKKEWHDLGQDDANALFLREPQLRSAKSNLLAAQADVNQAELNLKRTEIRIPFNSRVLEKYVDTGQYVTAGSRIAKVFSTNSVDIRLPLTDKQAALLDLPQHQKDQRKPHPLVTLSSDYAGKRYQWQGQLVRTEASVDVDSRVLYVIAKVADPFTPDEPGKPPLGIGMFVEAMIAGRMVDNVVSLPRRALQVDRQLLVLDADDRLHFKPVNVLQADAQQVLVSGPIQTGDRIVVSNLPMAVEGMKVIANSTVTIKNTQIRR